MRDGIASIGLLQVNTKKRTRTLISLDEKYCKVISSHWTLLIVIIKQKKIVHSLANVVHAKAL